MFITIQYPLFDHRNLDSEIKRVARPNWYQPDAADRIRYTGEILTKNKKYKGSWDSDTFYCNAQQVFSLSGTDDLHYFKELKSGLVQSQVMFRRLQADGNFLARYEIGFTDQFEDNHEPIRDTTTFKKIFIDHIRKYLNCPVKIKVGNSYKPYIVLAEAIRYLKLAYYWATLTGPKTFEDNDLKFKIESLDPLMIIHLNSATIPLEELGFKKVPLKGISNTTSVYYGTISYKPDIHAQTKNIDTWLIGHPLYAVSTPANKFNFSEFPQEIRDLRKSLLKTPSLVKGFKKLNGQLLSPFPLPAINLPEVQVRIVKFFHKAGEILLKEKSFKQDQQDIIGLSMDPGYYPESPSDILEQEFRNALNWIDGLPPTGLITKMQNELETRLNSYIKPLKPEPEKPQNKKPIIYFSYAWGDEKEIDESREKLINNLYDSLSADGFELRRDKMNLQYGGLITEFMKEIGEGDLIVIGISQKYLKSKYCMWELCEIWRNSKDDKRLFIPKLLPLIIEQLNLSSIEFLSEHLDYWNEQFNKISEFIAKYPQQIGQSQQDEHRRIRTIKDNFAEIVGLVADINTLTKDLIKAGDFKVIRETILERIKG